MTTPIKYQSNNEYVEKINRCYPRVSTGFMPMLEILNPSENNVEVMTIKFVQPYMRLNF